ncbi:MAG: FtsW/RodA/SpoVE family cell cycle protein [Anaerolineales bacterium]
MASATQSFRLSRSFQLVQRSLLILAGLFLGFYALALTLSPAARLRSWDVEYRWQHWLGYLIWSVLIIFADWQTRRKVPGRDPYLLPVAALLSGWGLLTIWRLYPDFGLRQTIWFTISIVVFSLGLRLPIDLEFLRRNKYILLTGGLILTTLTLIFGANPADPAGPRLWLGCCGFYFQPSEPLKLLLIIFLSAYLAGKKPWMSLVSIKGQSDAEELGDRGAQQSGSQFSLFAPLLFMTGLTVLLLLVQRDLGTATIFLFLFAVITYLATERKILLVMSTLLLGLAALGSYFLFDVVRLRIDAWLNPWIDPSNRSYQIVQSLIALANGGVGGRGPGMGSPTLVPISHSDFIFSAIVEEGGLLGGVGLIILLMLLAASGIRISLKAPDNFRRYLAAGLTAYLIGQSLLIIGGNIRLLPLTGVTLPFVSYGGSSLLTAYISLLLLVLISQSGETNPKAASNPDIYIRFGQILLVSLLVAGVLIGWWTYQRGPALLERTDNARRSIADQYVKRGDINDRDNHPIVSTVGTSGNLMREYLYPGLGSLMGYNHPVYGQTGLEATLDPYLRGLEGQSALLVWWNHLLYGQPPPGADVRLHLDMDLQQKANQLLADQRGAMVLINAENGEVLTMASQPSYEPALIEENWSELIADADTPLLNRAVQGRYAPGTVLGPFILAAVNGKEGFDTFGFDPDLISDADIDCALDNIESSWSAAIMAGCPGAEIKLADFLGEEDFEDLLNQLEFFTAVSLDSQIEEISLTPPAVGSPEEVIRGHSDFRVSPLQVARAAAALSAGGEIPEPQLTAALNIPGNGWMVIPASNEKMQVFPELDADATSWLLADDSLPIWQAVGRSITSADQVVSWYIAGTLPSWTGARFTLVTVLETDSPQEALEIGREMMVSALQVEQ